MKHFPILLIFSILFLNFHNASSQTTFLPAYIITNDNDTVYGLAGYNRNMNSFSVGFKTDETAAEKIYKPFDIQGFRFEGAEFYVSRELVIDSVSKPYFMELLVKGIASLYYFVDESKTDHYFIEKEDGTMHELRNDLVKSSTTIYTDHSYYSTNRHIGILKALFSDCPDIQDDLNKAKMTHGSLISLTSEYHDYMCDTWDCVVYQKEGPFMKLGLGLVAGTHLYNYGFSSNKYYENFTLHEKSGFDAGIELALKLPFLNGNSMLILNPNYSRANLFGNTTISNIYKTEDTDIDLDLNYLHTTLSFRYQWPGKVNPGFNIGIGVMNILGYESVRDVDITEGTEVYPDYVQYNSMPVPKVLAGAHGGAVLGLSTGSKTSVNLNILYSIYMGDYNAVDSNSLMEYVAVGYPVRSIISSFSVKIDFLIL